MELRLTAQREGRLSSFLRRELRMSAGLVNRLKWKNALFVNGQPRHTDYPVQPGDVIAVMLEEEAPEYPAEEGPLSILYEDEAVLALDKPAGLMMHPPGAATPERWRTAWPGTTGRRASSAPSTR